MQDLQGKITAKENNTNDEVPYMQKCRGRIFLLAAAESRTRLVAQVGHMKIIISNLERELEQQFEQKALFQAKALESCELSEMWADKYRQDHDKRKRVRQRIMGEALAAIRRRLGRSVKFSALLEWRNLAGMAVRSRR